MNHVEMLFKILSRKLLATSPIVLNRGNGLASKLRDEETGLPVNQEM